VLVRFLRLFPPLLWKNTRYGNNLQMTQPEPPPYVGKEGDKAAETREQCRWTSPVPPGRPRTSSRDPMVQRLGERRPQNRPMVLTIKAWVALENYEIGTYA